MQFEQIKQLHSREELYELYIVQDLSIEKIHLILKISDSSVSKLLKEYQITKDRDSINKSRGRSHDCHFESLVSKISKEELYEKYIVQNQRYDDLRQEYGLTGWSFDRLLSYYGIHKDKKVSAYIGLTTKYAQAGSKENYFKKLNQVRDQNAIEKYGSVEKLHETVSNSCKKYWSTFTPQERKERIKQSLAHGGGWNQKTIEKTNIERYGVPNQFLRDDVTFNLNHVDSKPNLAFKKLLESYHLNVDDKLNREYKIGNKSYDFFINGVLVEIDPAFTHNSTYGVNGKSDTALSKTYHKDKTQVALDNGFRCIHVWDWDDVEKVIKLLLPMSRIYARKCFLKDVSVEEEKEFLTANHLQGYVKSRVALGLYYDRELVSLMTFGKPRYNNKCEWELLRFCSTYNIIGGKEKLFKYFLDNYNPQSVVSYCDLSKFTGKSYQQLGFVKQSESISKHWYNIQYNIHITDNLLRQRGFDQLFGSDYGKGVSNRYLMLQHEFVEVYDCGQATFVYTKNN